MRRSTLIRLCRARDALRDRHSEVITVEMAAQTAEMSKYHFIRTFKSTFGQTPHEFLRSVRLDRAKELLIIDNHSVTEICFEVGYSSLGSFSDVFAKQIGLSPSMYRQRARSLVQVPGVISQQFIPFCFARMYSR